MNHQQVKHISNDHYKKIKKDIEQVSGGFDLEAIHRLRVEYKKLRAFFRMLSAGKNSDEEIRVPKKLKKYYAISGNIRDLQLQQQRILEVAKQMAKRPTVYLRLLQGEIEKLKPELIEIALEDPVTESKKKTDPLLPDKFDLSGFTEYIRHKWAAINGFLLAGNFSDDNIHAIRKFLKDLFYNVKEYKGAKHKTIAAATLNGRNENYFESLLNELGRFQDQCTAIALLKNYWINSLNTYNKEWLENLKKQWIKDKVKMKQVLIRKIKNDLLF